MDGKTIRRLGNGIVTPGQEVLKKKNVAVGWTLIILGLIGLVLALTIYPTWQHNKDALPPKEHYVDGTEGDRATVETQGWLVTYGFLFGTPIFLGGAYLVVTRSLHNKRGRELIGE
jgi:hypothetical protein